MQTVCGTPTESGILCCVVYLIELDINSVSAGIISDLKIDHIGELKFK